MNNAGRRFMILLAGLVVSVDALANALDPCNSAPMLNFSPAHPSPSDSVSAGVAEGAAGQLLGTRYVRLRVSASEIDVDVVASYGTDASFLLAAGYSVPSPSLSYGVAQLGMLPVGTYVTKLSFGQYDSGAGNGQSIVPFCAGIFTSSLVVTTQSAPVQTKPVIEYYDAALDHYFITQDTTEIAALDGGALPGWVRTGQSFLAYVVHQSDNRGQQVCRWYTTLVNRPTHFFSASADECNFLINAYDRAWTQELANAFEMPLQSQLGGCPTNTIPVYRLWNNRVDSDHRYTTDVAIKNAMIASGYVAEGYGPNAVAMCAPAQ